MRSEEWKIERRKADPIPPSFCSPLWSSQFYQLRIYHLSKPPPTSALTYTYT